MTLREKFEQLISSFPYERSLSRHPADSSAWPGQYVDYCTQLAWEMYQAGNAASGRDQLLQALQEIEQEYLDDSRHGALASKLAAIANRAIKKARGK